MTITILVCVLPTGMGHSVNMRCHQHQKLHQMMTSTNALPKTVTMAELVVVMETAPAWTTGLVHSVNKVNNKLSKSYS